MAASCAQAAASFVSFGMPAIGLELRRSFGLSLAELGAVLSAHLLGTVLALFAAGVIVDRFGPRTAMTLGTAVAGGSLVAGAFAGSVVLLFLALVIFGIGAAAVPIAGVGALFRAYPIERRGWAMGVRQMAVPIGGMAAAILLPLLAAIGGIQLALLAGAAVVAVTGFGFARAAGAGPLSTVRPRLAPRDILRTPGMKSLMVVATSYVVVLQAALTFTVPAAHAAGLSSFATGAVFFALNATGAVARIAWGRLSDRDGGTRRGATIVHVGLVAAVGAPLFGLALHAGAVLAIGAAVVLGFGALGWNGVVYVSAGERTPVELAGQSVAIILTGVSLVAVLAAPPLGALAEHIGWDAFWLTASAFALTGAAVAGALQRTPRRV